MEASPWLVHAKPGSNPPVLCLRGTRRVGALGEVLKGHCILVRAAELAYNSPRSTQLDAYYLNCSSATGSASVISAGSLNCLGGLPAGAAVGRFSSKRLGSGVALRTNLGFSNGM